MIKLPPLRRLLLPSLLCLAFILWYRSTVQIPTTRISSYLIRQPEVTVATESIPVTDLASNQIILRPQADGPRSTPVRLYYSYNEPGATYDNGTEIPLTYTNPSVHPYLQKLLECPRKPNRFTDHIRFPNALYNISIIYKNETANEHKGTLNPAIISLPDWSENQYLLISRVATDGSHQHNLLCEANICVTGEPKPGERACDADATKLLGGTHGLRCAAPPIIIDVPPTPAESCPGNMILLSNIPGFHDPRVFWSGRGEPLMMVNSQSRYACFGLWVIDLRKVYPGLEHLLKANPQEPGSLGPLMSYPSLTEITRNPKKSRGMIEKNWMFFSSTEGSYIHYDMAPTKRTFAKLLGGGLTTANLTDPLEVPCLEDAASPSTEGTWHQGTNSLRLVLCSRTDADCQPNEENQVFFSLIHHKHKSLFDLPLRYERYFMVWSAAPPFSMLGVSRYPLLFANETAQGFTDKENWDDDPEDAALRASGRKGKGKFASFTYTVSIAWAWGRKRDRPEDKNVGYLDDEVILGVGVDDAYMNYATITAQELLACLRACPGRGQPPYHLVPKKKLKEDSKDDEEDEEDEDDELEEDEDVEEIDEEEEEGTPEKSTAAGKKTGSHAKAASDAAADTGAKDATGGSAAETEGKLAAEPGAAGQAAAIKEMEKEAAIKSQVDSAEGQPVDGIARVLENHLDTTGTGSDVSSGDQPESKVEQAQNLNGLNEGLQRPPSQPEALVGGL